MAKKTIVTLVDDLDGTPIEGGGGESITFSINGRSYEIDLSAENAEAFRAALKPYTEAGRPVASGGRAPRGTGAARTATTSSRGDLAAARTWLREHGYEVGDRGRIPADLLEAYRAAK
ncbi:Lsr2 family protein [Agromyces sp. MMS24-JH15]|uniref:histone-like nucleoid-structuring protein Lsr2 n=1 Tax=Agromyces sp. MMS24-JH15 TaxID=3243765 RepID=UPI003747880A